MAKPLLLLGTGASGAWLFSNTDLLNELLPQDFVHRLTPSPRETAPSQEVQELQSMVARLSTQMQSVSASQRNNNQPIIVTTSPQTQTFLGISVFKIGVWCGIAGYIYFRLFGFYRLREFVAKSKKQISEVSGGWDGRVMTAATDLWRLVGTHVLTPVSVLFQLAWNGVRLLLLK